jgi:ankyrin repeat protein
VHQAAGDMAAVGALVLVRAGDVGAEDEQGRTPLHLAAATGETQVVRALVTRHHADVSEM